MIELKSIAKQWKSISLREFSSSYNDLKIVNQEDLDKLSNIKIGSEAILVMAVKKHKTPTITMADLMKEIKSINARLDSIENLVLTKFKEHSWI